MLSGKYFLLFCWVLSLWGCVFSSAFLDFLAFLDYCNWIFNPRPTETWTPLADGFKHLGSAMAAESPQVTSNFKNPVQSPSLRKSRKYSKPKYLNSLAEYPAISKELWTKEKMHRPILALLQIFPNRFFKKIDEALKHVQAHFKIIKSLRFSLLKRPS